MNLRNINFKNVLIILLASIIGFCIGMVVTFEIVINKLENYNIKIDFLI